jgi:ubiquinone/menaquinone biosynthesis C-methylase UbiE
MSSREPGRGSTPESLSPVLDKDLFEGIIHRSLVLVSSVAPGLGPWLQTAVMRTVYSAITAVLKDEDVAFLNYGYAPLDGSPMALALEQSDEADRYSIQLYYRVAGATDLSGKNVLEIGCGRGGGASFIARYLGPTSMTAVDLSPRAVRYCQRRHQVRNLKFLEGDAENLQLPSASFDAVVNVESSHCYPSFERFLGEVARVLRPGGMFLFADLRARHDVVQTREQLRQRFAVVEEEAITPNVVRALDLDSDRRRALIRKRTPKLLHKHLQTFASVNGTPVFDAFRSGTLQYVRFVLQKPAA